MVSHPSRVRELKLGIRKNVVFAMSSHPSRVRELKQGGGVGCALPT